MKELILGGARSGKSRYAEQCAQDSGLPVIYVATGAAGDAEMAERIKLHRKSRPTDWHLIEESIALADTLRAVAAADRCVLVDCLTLWLSNLLLAEEAAAKGAASEFLARERAALLEVFPTLPGHLILVSNEVGLGVVPDSAIARRFRDEAGRLHQALAALCDRVVFMAAGLALPLKSE
jgi:adenosylcobinamide kinase/adenosylcobinamide-phosphate guanylyltransferase